jgi:hypothetical protein
LHGLDQSFASDLTTLLADPDRRESADSVEKVGFEFHARKVRA